MAEQCYGMATEGPEVNSKTLTVAALAAALVFGGAASCDADREPTEWYQTEFPDCDADDRKGKWDVADCGPSPQPMRTAYQPAPSPKRTHRSPGR